MATSDSNIHTTQPGVRLGLASNGDGTYALMTAAAADTSDASIYTTQPGVRLGLLTNDDDTYALMVAASGTSDSSIATSQPGVRLGVAANADGTYALMVSEDTSADASISTSQPGVRIGVISNGDGTYALMTGASGTADNSVYVPTSPWLRFGLVSNSGIFGLMTAGSGGGGGPTPALNLDLTSSLPASVTFTRAGTRNAIQSGALASVATGVPAFESWDGVSRGMAVDASASLGTITQALTYSNTISDASWVKARVTNGTGGTGPDGVANSLTAINETAVTNTHILRKQLASVSSGTTHTLSAIVKNLSGSSNWSVLMRMSAEFNTAGVCALFMLNGVPGHTLHQTGTPVATNVSAGVRKLANNLYQIWVTGTWSGTGTKDFEVNPVSQAGTGYVGVTQNYAGNVANGFEIYGLQVTPTAKPTGWVTTVAAGVAQAAETAVFNDITWFNSAEGTFVVEHDCETGPLIGSGVNVVLPATVAGKVAIAWDATANADTVNNGGSAASATKPTFGADIRLLATNAVGNVGHIKSIKYYATRLSVAEMQTLTAPTVTSTANPGALRAASIENRMPSTRLAAAGTQLNFASRYRLKLASATFSSLKLDFANFRFSADTTGNAVTIDACYLERVTGVAESVQVLFGGSGSAAVADGASAVSDSILPSSFTSLSAFPADGEFWVRIRGHVASAGQFFPVSRNRVEPSGPQSFAYDPATYTLTNFTGTGSLTASGSGFSNVTTNGPCPILVGVYSSGDPKTVFITGDSLVEGIGGLDLTGAYMRKACAALGIACIEHSVGGSSQVTLQALSAWRPYLGYCRIFASEFGTNDFNRILNYFDIWNACRSTYSMDKIMHTGIFPSTTSTDSWATEANQTVTAGRTYPNNFETFLAYAETQGYTDANTPFTSIRGVNTSKWIVNGAANYSTPDGGHATPAGDDLMKTEWQAVLDALTLT